MKYVAGAWVESYTDFGSIVLSRALVLLSTFDRFINIVLMIFSHRAGRFLAMQPMLPTKYLSNFYLTPYLTLRQRADATFFHYDYILRKMSPHYAYAMFNDGVSIAKLSKNGCDYSINLRVDKKHTKEGEMSLCLKDGGDVLYTLSFTIVRGSIVGGGAEAAFLVTRIQGMRDRFGQIAQATKAFRDVAPPLVLLSALEGLGMALDIYRLTSVSAATVVRNAHQMSTDFSNSYDRVLESLGAVQNAKGFFSAALPFKKKPLDAVSADHRARTRKKRAFRDEIGNCARSAVSKGRLVPERRASGWEMVQGATSYAR